MADKNESFENRKKGEISEQEVVEILKIKGGKDRQALDLLKKWQIHEESRRPAGGLEAILFNIELNRKIANIYFKSGFEIEVLDILDLAYQEARQNGLARLCKEVDQQMKEIETKLPQ